MVKALANCRKKPPARWCPLTIHSRPLRLTPDRLALAKPEFDTMWRESTARRAEGPLSSTLHLVLKKDRGWRPCGDYRAPNARNVPDRYRVPHIQDYCHLFTNCTNFSKVDLVRAYHQIPVHPKDIQGCNYHTLRPFLIPFHVLWLKKRCPNLPTFYE